ncbi:alpha-1,3-mannosyl-glycoprotein 4-beta-N-acetylglucosaminyltransferase A-like isoform X2 [Anneissia japonica]|uniref:alpha-1,3-mannosyl-glycoprotein 4-beta-N-acetylglucosaminyltransferase A-like isoform X1 n=2 Tax=Anneissia japonica TaxID=1529436 RepID=UPI00142556E3|nr:alpha-1,3-mannosyl-glycoprotein 4-beta-N-acetylglucosaminyltransferase A-like isoform X1 [Anneissia japonica]XP_033112077.1 alpha-1,3-mannosyl-glycoprotein 4-beta-N-acetylglucosaminyltransferase A-like isoform X2 [Anneissia japonica]
MGHLRRNTVILLTVICFAVCFITLSNNPGEDSRSLRMEYDEKVKDLDGRLQETLKLHEARKIEIYHLQRQVVRALEEQKNISASLRDGGGVKRTLSGLSGNSQLHLPSALSYLPHINGKPESLQPAFQLSQGISGVSIIIGIPTIKREIESYIIPTLRSLLDGLSPEEKLDCLIVVFIAELDITYVKSQSDEIKDTFPREIESGLLEVISPPASYYPDLDNLKETFGDSKERVKWRTKQNLDFSFLMMYCQPKATFYVQLEDDIIAKPGYITTMKNFAQQQKSDDWVLLEFSSLGFIGKLFKSSDLGLVVEFFLMFHKEKPIDWLLDHILYVKVCNPEKDNKHCTRQKAQLRIRFKPSLYQHVGTHSSLKGKLQKLKDKDFGKGKLPNQNLNPPAEVSTTIKPYQKYTLDKAYKGEDIFWGILPKAGSVVRFIFNPPIKIQSYRFISGNADHPGDIFTNTTVEVMPSYQQQKKEGLLETNEDSKLKHTKDGYIQIGTFKDGKIMGEMDKKIDKVQEIQLRVQSNAKAWVILSDIRIVQAKKR